MKKLSFSELLSEMYPLVLHNIGLIRLWNDYDGIEYNFNGNTIRVKTILLEPLKSIIPTSFSLKDHKAGNFKMFYESDTLIKVDGNRESLLYSSDYIIKISLNHLLISVNQVLKDPSWELLGHGRIKIPTSTNGGYPDISCEISSLSEDILDKLRRISKRMQSKRIKYLKGLVTDVKDKKYSSRDVRNKLYEQLDLINIFQQSLMELDHPDLMVFNPLLDYSGFESTGFKSAATIYWSMMDVSQSIKLHITPPHPYDDHNEEKEYVFGWSVDLDIFNR